MALAVVAFLVGCGGASSNRASMGAPEPTEPEQPSVAPAASEAIDAGRSEPAEPARLSIAWVPLAVGAKWDTTFSAGIRALLTGDGPNGRVTVEDYSSEVDQRIVEVMAFRGSALTKVRVTFVDKVVTLITNGRQLRAVSPLSGKTYVLEMRDQGLAIVDDRNRDVTPTEGRLLSLLFKGLGARDELGASIPHAPMRVGEPLPAMAEGLKKDFQAALGDQVTFGRVSVTPAGVRHVDGVDCVVFALVLQVGFELNGRSVHLDGKGEMLLRASDGQLASIELRGPETVELSVRGVAVHGGGDAWLKESFTYP